MADEGPKRATAAQLANRKIKAAHTRRGRTGSPNPIASPQETVNPFNTINPNLVPTASSNSTFGQSQSFPPSFGASGQQPQKQSASVSLFGDQNNSPFKPFGAQPSSAPSSFTFDTLQPLSNPFSASSASEAGFQGFKGNMFSIPPTTNQNQQGSVTEQASATSSIFSMPQQHGTQANPFQFGAKSTTTSAPLFGSTAPSTSTSTSGMFGQQPVANIFSPPKMPTFAAPNIFGASASPTQDEKRNDAMQVSPNSQPAAGVAKANLFKAPSDTKLSTTLSTTPSTFSFGAPLSQTSAGTGTSGTAPLFSLSTKLSASAPSGGFSLFGASSKPEQSQEPASTAPSSTPSATSTTKPTTSAPFASAIAPNFSLFGNLQKSEDSTRPTSTAPFSATTQPSKSQPPSTTMFGLPSKKSTGTLFGVTSKEQPSSASTSQPFSALATSAQTPTTNSTSLSDQHPAKLDESLGKVSEKPGSATPTTEAAKTSNQTTSVFAPSSTTTTLFGQPAKSTTTAVSSTTSTSIFQPPSTMLPSSQMESSKQQNSPPKTATLLPLTDKLPSAAAAAAAPGMEPPTSEAKQNSLFGVAPSTMTPWTSSGNNISSGSCSTLFPPKPTTRSVSQNRFTFPSEQTREDNVISTSTDREASVAAQRVVQVKPSEKFWQEKPASVVKSSLPPPFGFPRRPMQEPEPIDETTWRIRRLNESFRRKLAQVDSASEDVDVLLEFYVRMRESLGKACSLDLAGTKRKSRDDDQEENLAESYKRHKAARAEINRDASKPPASSSFQKDGTDSPAKKVGATTGTSSLKRRAPEPDKETSPAGTTEKRSKHTNTAPSTEPESGRNGISDTATIFASSFVSQKNRSPSPVNEHSSASSASQGVNGSALGSQESSGDEDHTSATSPSPPPSGLGGGRSLFDRIQLDPAGQPVRRVEARSDTNQDEDGNKESDPIAALFTGSKFASAFNTPGTTTPKFSFTGSGVGTPRSPSPVTCQDKQNKGTESSAPPSMFQTFFPPKQDPKLPSEGTPTPTTQPSESEAPSIHGTSSSSSIFNVQQTTSPPSGVGSNTPVPAIKLTAPSQLGISSFPFSVSATTSIEGSRASTPAPSDTGADDSGEGATESLPQVDLTRAGAGEEDEEVVFEVRAKAMKLVPDAGWKNQGVGILRVLKNRKSSRSRILLRADPSGNIVLNANLVPQVSYKQDGSSVTFYVFKAAEKPEHWGVRVKTTESAAKLASTLEECKVV